MFKTSRHFTALCFIFMVLAVALSSLYNFNHNDMMYAAAPTIKGALYQDINFVQAPLGFYFLKLVTIIAPQGFLYLFMRGASVLLFILAIFTGAQCFRNAAARGWFYLFTAGATYLLYGGREIANYALALVFLSGAVFILWRHSEKRWALFSAALLVGLAASAKLNHVLFFSIFLPFIFMGANGSIKVIIQRIGMVMAGGLIGVSPVLYYLATIPYAFLLNNVIFHASLTSQIREGSTQHKSFLKILRWVVQDGLLLVPFIYLVCKRHILSWRRYDARLAMLAIGSVTALIAAISPGIIFPQYLIPASFFLAIAVACLMEARNSIEIMAKAVKIAMALIVLNMLMVGAGIVRLAVKQGIEPDAIAVHNINRNVAAMAAKMDAAQCNMAVFSFASAFAMDSAFYLTPPNAAGIFWARLRGILPQEYLTDERYHFNRDTLFPEQTLVEKDIRFIVAGYYPKFDEPVERYAAEQGFAALNIGHIQGRDITLYYDPSCIRKSR